MKSTLSESLDELTLLLNPQDIEKRVDARLQQVWSYHFNIWRVYAVDPLPELTTDPDLSQVGLNEPNTYDVLRYTSDKVSFILIEGPSETKQFTLYYGMRCGNGGVIKPAANHMRNGKRGLEFLAAISKNSPIITSLLLRHEPWKIENRQDANYWTKEVYFTDGSEILKFLTSHAMVPSYKERSA